MTDELSVKCATCKVELEGPPEANGDDTFACPSCGESDTLDNIMREIDEYVEERTADILDDDMRDATRFSKSVEFKSEPRPKKAYRFVIDLDL